MVIMSTPSSGAHASARVRKHCSWTACEHLLFLLGVDEMGRASWKTIAADFVLTRSATQVRRALASRFSTLSTLSLLHVVCIDCAALLRARVCEASRGAARKTRL